MNIFMAVCCADTLGGDIAPVTWRPIAGVCQVFSL